MDKTTLVLHVGYPKTGSTTLQYGLFKHLHEKGQLHLKTWRQYDPEEPLPARLSSLLFQRLPVSDRYRELETGKINIVSDESLTAPVRLRQNNFGKAIEDPRNFPKVLSNTYAERVNAGLRVKVLVVIRNQANLLYSQYVEEYKLVLYKSIDLLHDKTGNLDLTGMDVYCYSTYLESVKKAFGAENVVLALFEDWKHEPKTFFGQIASVVQCDTALVQEQLTKIHKNKKEKNTQGYLTEVSKILVPYFGDEKMKRIIDHFAASNARLESEWGIPKEKLKAYGYI